MCLVGQYVGFYRRTLGDLRCHWYARATHASPYWSNFGFYLNCLCLTTIGVPSRNQLRTVVLFFGLFNAKQNKQCRTSDTTSDSLFDLRTENEKPLKTRPHATHNFGLLVPRDNKLRTVREKVSFLIYKMKLTSDWFAATSDSFQFPSKNVEKKKNLKIKHWNFFKQLRTLFCNFGQCSSFLQVQVSSESPKSISVSEEAVDMEKIQIDQYRSKDET